MVRTFMGVFWPSFLTAIAAVGVFFSVFDPEELVSFGVEHNLPALGIYTLGFFFFWCIGAASITLARYLDRRENEPSLTHFNSAK